MLFPGEDRDGDADILEVNTIVSADAEEGSVSFGRSEGLSEEDDRLNQGLDNDNVFSSTFSAVSYGSYASSASSLGLLDSCLELCPNFCDCIENLGSSDCIGYNGLVVCSVCCCLNYTENIHCIHCLELIKVKSCQTSDVNLGFESNNVYTQANQVYEGINAKQVCSFTSEIGVHKKDPYKKFRIPRQDPTVDPEWCCEQFDMLQLGAHIVKLSVDLVSENTADVWSQMVGRDIKVGEKLLGFLQNSGGNVVSEKTL